MTPATRQQHRRAQFNDAVIASGWLGESEYVTAVINHLVKVPAPTRDALRRRENEPQRHGVGRTRSGKDETR